VYGLTPPEATAEKVTVLPTGTGLNDVEHDTVGPGVVEEMVIENLTS
jgi:hypothetical protein